MNYFFLCDECRERLVTEAFNNRPPIYCDDPIEGFCGLCNSLTDVRFCQWFLCTICCNVISSAQKTLVSARAVEVFWRTDIQTLLPDFLIEETDPFRLSPYARGGKTKRQGADTISHADFLVSERIDNRTIPRFHIELKTGPGSIDAMTEFQLDVNDYNDIMGPGLNTGLPVYVFHVQVGLEYLLPTRRAVALNLWWSDMALLQTHIKRQGNRREETKAAIYFDPTAFRSKDLFGDQLSARRFEILQKWLLETPPRLI